MTLSVCVRISRARQFTSWMREQRSGAMSELSTNEKIFDALQMYLREDSVGVPEKTLRSSPCGSQWASGAYEKCGVIG